MKRITLPEEGIETLFGNYDENLKHLESLFNVRIRTQGHDLQVDGDAAGTAKVDRILDQLSSLMRDGYKLSNGDVKIAADLVSQSDDVDLRDHFLKGSLTAAGRRQAALEKVVAQIDRGVLRDQVRGGLDVGIRQLHALAHQ